MENTKEKSDIGKEIRKIRKSLGLTQRELGERIGKTRFDIANYENEGRAIPSALTYLRIMALKNGGLR